MNVSNTLRNCEKKAVFKRLKFKKKLVIKNKYSRECVILGYRLNRIRGSYWQKHVAEALGVSRSVVADWEVGARLIPPELLIRYIRFFKLSKEKEESFIELWCKALCSSGETRQAIYANKYHIERPFTVKKVKDKVFPKVKA